MARSWILGIVLACGAPRAAAPATTSVASAPAVDRETPFVVPGDVVLPECSELCSAGTPLDPKHATVVVSKTEVRLEGASGAPLVVPVLADASHGVDATYKRGGANALYITPLGDALSAEQTRTGASSIAIVADRATPYRLLAEVLFTAGQNKFDHFFVAERIAGKLVWKDYVPPTLQRLGKVPEHHLSPVVVALSDGFVVRVSGGSMAPGCRELGAGVTVTTRDYAGLRHCLTQLKSRSPDFTGETEVVVACSAAIPLEVLIAMHDAIGTTDDGRSLFPRVSLGIAR